MRLKLQNLRLLDVRQILAVAAVVLIFCTTLVGLLDSQKANAATASTMNFQARLMNDDGSIAPDGNYNIEFKFYDTASTGGTAQGVCTGNCKWVETRTGGSAVTVVNGYITVNLGSVTAFGSSINWDKELWMTMNVGGTGTPSWDGEMTPRLKLTAVPYAFSAGKLATEVSGFTGVLQFAGTLGQDSTITLPDPGAGGTATVCYQGSSGCGFLTGSGSAFLQGGNSFGTTATLGTNDANDLVLERNNAAMLTIGASDLTVSSNIDLLLQGATAYISNPGGGTASEMFGLNTVINGINALAVGNGAQADDYSVALGTNANASVNQYSVVVGSGSTVTGAGGITLGYSADAAANAIAIGPDAQATFAGSIAIGADAQTGASDQLVIGGGTTGINSVVIGNGVTAATPTNVILKGTGGSGTDVAGANVTIAGGQSTGNAFGGSVNIQISAPGGSSGSSANSLTTVASFGGATGAALFQNAANSTQAFRIQNVANNNLFIADTTNSRVGINLSGTPSLAGAGLEVNGALRLSGTVTDTFATPVGSNVASKINIPAYDPGAFGQILAFGLPSTAQSTSRALSVFDQRAGAHQPSLAVFSPNENEVGGFSWDGSNTALLIKNTASGSIGLHVGGSTVLSVTTSGADITGQLSVTSLGTANTTTYLCRNASNIIATCSGGGDFFTQGGNDFNATAVLGTNDIDNLQFETNNVVRATFDTSNNLYLGNGVTAGTPSNFAIQGTGSSTTAVTGGSLTVQGGNATVGSANGGNITLTGGAGVGTGVRGLVVIDTPTITTASAQNCSSSCNVTQANIDSNGVVLINATNPSLTATLSDPTITTAGRIMYVTNVGANDFTLSVNGGGTGNTIAMKPNTTATMIWSGSDWTAAGASSSTDLQSAYNNTLTSAGGAELVLNAPGGSADGLTIRNNATTPIVGGILEVQTSIGSSLLSVNNNATEYATNGGAETAGASSSTFPSSTWDTTTGGTVDRWTTVGDNIATGQASVRVQTTTTNHGARNRLSTALTSGLTYTVSFAVRDGANFSTLQVLYSPDGTTTGTTQCATGQTVTSGIWRRITCSFVASGTITSSNSILIRQTDATARTFYIDNLSINVNASATFAADGSVDVVLGSNWTAFGTLDSLTRDTSVIYDTSGSVNVNTPNAADRGVRNNLAITPAASTQYLVTFYVRSTNTFNDIRVRYTRDGGTNFVSCVDYNTQTVSTTSFTEISCLFTTDSTTPSDPDLIIDQPTGSDRSFYIDALSITLNTNNSNNVQVGGANKGGPTTLFTLDRSNGAPIAANNEAYLGSMYYDTTSGRIQCYEADGWGACGAAPDNIVNLNPEYAGAVLNGSGIGTMTADFCANQTSVLQVNYATSSDPCFTSGDVKNYYKWTSPQSTEQTYSIYVTYQLPATFNGFSSDDTVQLTGRVTDTTNAALTYQMYYKTPAGSLTQCWDSVTAETTVATSNNTWQSVGVNGNEATGCGLSASAANGFIIFKINMKAKSNASAFASTLSFTTTGR